MSSASMELIWREEYMKKQEEVDHAKMQILKLRQYLTKLRRGGLSSANVHTLSELKQFMSFHNVRNLRDFDTQYESLQSAVSEKQAQLDNEKKKQAALELESVEETRKVAQLTSRLNNSMAGYKNSYQTKQRESDKLLEDILCYEAEIVELEKKNELLFKQATLANAQLSSIEMDAQNASRELSRIFHQLDNTHKQWVEETSRNEKLLQLQLNLKANIQVQTQNCEQLDLTIRQLERSQESKTQQLQENLSSLEAHHSVELSQLQTETNQVEITLNQVQSSLKEAGKVRSNLIPRITASERLVASRLEELNTDYQHSSDKKASIESVLISQQTENTSNEQFIEELAIKVDETERETKLIEAQIGQNSEVFSTKIAKLMQDLGYKDRMSEECQQVVSVLKGDLECEMGRETSLIRKNRELLNEKGNITRQVQLFKQLSMEAQAAHQSKLAALKESLLNVIKGSHLLADQKTLGERLQQSLIDIDGIVSEKLNTIGGLEVQLAEVEKTIGLQNGKLQELARQEAVDRSYVRRNESLRIQLEEKAEANNKLKERLKDEQCLHRYLQNKLMDLKGTVRVFCRARPLQRGEGSSGGIEVLKHEKQINLKQHQFKFDQVFDHKSSNSEVFTEIDLLAQNIFNGFNVCVFAYGQTGSGKTFTMLSSDGVVYQSMQRVYKVIEKFRRCQVFASFYEIYNDKISDLTTCKKGKTVKNPGCKKEWDEIEVGSYKELRDVFDYGVLNRSTSSTNMNSDSSRSHIIFSIRIETTCLRSGKPISGKLNLVDLAGSERVNRSQVTGQQLKEAQAINKSLSALGDVIMALSQNKSHIPFRSSKLTHILQDSLTGKSKTLMLVNISPSIESLPETLTSLRFAERVNSTKLGR